MVLCGSDGICRIWCVKLGLPDVDKRIYGKCMGSGGGCAVCCLCLSKEDVYGGDCRLHGRGVYGMDNLWNRVRYDNGWRMLWHFIHTMDKK